MWRRAAAGGDRHPGADRTRRGGVFPDWRNGQHSPRRPSSAQAWAIQATRFGWVGGMFRRPRWWRRWSRRRLRRRTAHSSTSGMVVVSGRVSVADGGLVAGVVVGFQHSDCPDCVRYTATTNPSGRYRAVAAGGPIPGQLRAYRHPGVLLTGGRIAGRDPGRTHQQRSISRSRLLSSGRDGVGAHIGPPLPRPPRFPRTRRPWIVTPFHR